MAVTTDAAVPESATRGAWPLERAVRGAILLVAAVLLVVVHGFAPFSVGASVIHLVALGRVECGATSIVEAFTPICALVGGPLGGLYATNIPVIGLASLLTLIGIPAAWSLGVVFVLVFVLGLWAAQRLLRLLGVRPWLALVGAVAYGLSPAVVLSVGYGGMTAGVMLLPLMVLLAFTSRRALESIRPARTAGVLVAWAAVAIALLLSDGYTYVMGVFAAGVIWITLAWGRWRRLATWLHLGALVLVVGVSFAVYRLVVPTAGAWGTDDIDSFRAYGLDVATLVLPTETVWWADALGLGLAGDSLWGGGRVAEYNYLGLGMLVLAVIGLILHSRSDRRAVIALGMAALGALVLALGPSLKVAAVFDPSLSDAVNHMPLGVALVDFPWAWIFEDVPGLQYMRAIYRWIILVHLCVLLLATVGVESLLRRRRVVLASVLGTVAVVEVALNPVAAVAANSERAAAVTDFDATVTRPLSEALNPDDTVIFVNDAAPRHNDYLATYLAPTVGVTTWNIGNDKALRRARQAWPDPVSVLIAGDFAAPESLDAAAAALEDGTASAIVVTYFDMRDGAIQWPPPQEHVRRGEQIADMFRADPRFTVVDDGTFAVVRAVR